MDAHPPTHPILVTGGAGFIGAHVARLLCDAGHEVVVLDDLSGGRRENVDPRARFVEGSILDVATVDRLFHTHRFVYVFHLAAYAAEGLSHFIRRYNYENNLIGTVNVVNASVRGGVRRFVFTSSIAVYGSLPPPMREDIHPAPEDPYGVAKYAVELDLAAAHHLFGLEYVIFRPHNVYGELQNLGDKYRNVVGIFMNQILRGEPMPVFGDGSQTRAFSYIGDVAPAIVQSAFAEVSRNQIYNVGSDQVTSVKDLGLMVAEAFGVPPEFRHLPARQETVHAHACHEKIRRDLGFDSRTPLREGVARMAAWARTLGPQQPTPFGEIEVERNLPPSWRRPG